MRASNRRQSYLSRQYSTSDCALVSGTPCDQSPTVSRSGQRVLANLSLRSSSAACGTSTLKGVMSFVAVGSKSGADLAAVRRAAVSTSPADNIPAPPMNLRREECWSTPKRLPESSLFISCASTAVHASKLEHEHRTGLRNRCFGASNRVDAVLNALRIKSPTSRDGYVLLAIDFKGRWNTNHARGSREAPKLISCARVERPELPVGRSTGEEQVPSRHQKRRPEDGLEVVLPDALAGIQIPGLKLAEMIGSTRGGANGPEDALHFVSNIEPVDAVLRHITLRQKGADVVVRRDVQELRLRTPRLWRPVLSTSDARAELGALRDARTLRFIEDRSSRLRVNRREHVVVGEPEGVEKLQLSLIAIQNPEVSIAAGMCSRLDRLSVDLGVDQQGGRHFVPVKRIVRRVLMIALQLAGLDVERQRRVRVQVVAGTIVSNPRRRISSAPVSDVQCGIEDPGDPDGATSALVRIALPGVPAWLMRCGHRVGAPESLAALGVEGAQRAPDAKFPTGVADEDLASRSQRRQRCVAAGLVVIDLNRPGFPARGGIQRHESAIRGGHVNAIAVQSDPPIGRMQLKEALGIFLHIPPKLTAGLGIECDHVIAGRGDKHPPVVYDRRRFVGLDQIRIERPGEG